MLKCLICGKTVPSSRNDLFCSDECKQIYKYLRLTGGCEYKIT